MQQMGESERTHTEHTAVPGHVPSSRVRLSDRELSSDGLTSSGRTEEKTALRDASDIPLS